MKGESKYKYANKDRSGGRMNVADRGRGPVGKDEPQKATGKGADKKG
jgi:hypothetical protein